ncbi:MAG: PAS domain S-box protein [Anaerolineae bacterium]|nr:PAS domain S-box protein [Anaerolineae bacterium]
MIPPATIMAELEALGLLEAAQSDPRWLSLIQRISERNGRSLDNTQLMADALPDCVLYVDTAGHVLDANQTARDMFHRDGDVRSALTDILPAEVESRLLAAVRQAAETRLLQTLEFGLRGPHFAQQFEARVRAIGPSAALIVLRDITEQRWHQQVRAFSEDYFQSLLQRLNTGVLICTPDGDIMIANQALLRILDQRDEDLLGEPYPALARQIAADPDSYAALIQQFAAVQEGRAASQVTLHIQNATTGHVWLLVNADLERSPETQTRQIKFTFTDVTDFRNAETALRESEEQYAALMDRITDVIYHLDHEQEILFLNAAWPRLTGYSIEDSLGRSMLDFVHPQDRAACLAVFQPGIVSPHSPPSDIEIRLTNPDGSLCWVSLRNQPVTAANGSVIGNYGMMVNITDRKRSEETRALLTAKARTVELLMTLLRHLSHDLRTPLSVIRVTNFKLTRYWKQLQEQQLVESLGQTDSQVNRINAFLEEYSDLARLDIDLADFKTAPVGLIALVQDVVNGMPVDPSRPLHEWILDHDSAEIMIDGNAYWLSKMVRHILDNAVQFSPKGGPITIRLHRQQNEAILDVTDTGIGINPDDLEHIFEPFFRADKARAMSTALAGLGLTFVQRITDAHHGRVEIETALNQGTTVRLRLPAISQG